MPGSILDDIDIDVEEAEQMAKSIHTSELKPIAQVFARNVYDLLGLLSLPLVLLMVGASEVHRLVFFTQALVRTKNLARWAVSEEARAQVQAEVQRLFEEARRDPDSKFKPADEAKAQLAHLLEHHDLDAPVQALLSAAVSSAWATFECSAKDAWIVAINSRPMQLAHAAFVKLPDEPYVEGITGKHIAVGLLARHGFDLRDKLGTLLAPKFDFTGVSGIRSAYSAAFGKRTDLDEALFNPTLSVLEATRHLIVHRAGLIDEEYQRRTGDTTPVGQQIRLNGARISALSNAAVAAGCKLLQAIDNWFVSNP